MKGQNDETARLIDQLDGLYQKDPEEFEALRRKLIDQAIESFPPEFRQRAEGMQFEIEARLSKYKHPVMRMNLMVEIFWEQFHLFQQVVTNPEAVLEQKERSRGAAKVIPLRKPETLH